MYVLNLWAVPVLFLNSKRTCIFHVLQVFVSLRLSMSINVGFLWSCCVMIVLYDHAAWLSWRKTWELLWLFSRYDAVYAIGAAHATYSDSEILWADGGWAPNLEKPIYDKYNLGNDEMASTWDHPYNQGWNSVGYKMYGLGMDNYYSGWHYRYVCSVPKPGRN